MEEEFANFMQKVEEVSSIVKGLNSGKENEIEKACRRADIYLHDHKDTENIDEDGIRVTTDKTVINKKALEKDEGHMSQEAFMASVESDAKARAENRKQRKESSDSYKKIANQAFRQKNYVKALDHYNKAIAETNDSCVLYTNRALTCLHLKIYSRVLSDCNWAFKLSEDSLKAWLYKSKAHHCLGEEKLADDALGEALRRHPNHSDYIQEWKSLWDNPTATD